MRRAAVLGSLVLVFLFALSHARPARVLAQGAMPAGELPVEVGLPLLDDHLRDLAGMRVRVRGAVVDELLGPGSFVIEDGTTRGPRDSALVLVDGDVAGLHPGAPVVITGRATTYFGAGRFPGWRVLFTERMTDRFYYRPVVLADTVTTPEGIVLHLRPAGN